MSHRRRRVLVTAVLAVALATLGGVGAASGLHGAGARPGRLRARAGQHLGQAAVEVAVARQGSARVDVALSGVVVASATVNVVAALPGRVQDLAVVPGQHVHAGQEIADIADPLARGQLALARAAAATAVAKMRAGQAGPSAPSIAVAKATVNKAESALSAARSTYADTVSTIQQDQHAAIADAVIGVAKTRDALSAADQVLKDAEASVTASNAAAVATAKAAVAKMRATLAAAETSEQTAISVLKDAEASVTAANAAAVAVAKAAVAKAQNTLAAAETSEQTAITVQQDAQASVAAANAAAVASAEATLAKMQANAGSAASTEAADQQAVVQAQADQNDSSSDTAPADADTADALALSTAEVTLSNAAASTSAADAALSDASAQLSAAETPPGSTALATDAAAVTQAQQAVSSAQLGISEASAQLSAAETPPASTALATDAAAVTQAALSVRQAGLALAQARAPTPSALSAARSALSSAAAGVALARAQLAASDAPPQRLTILPLAAAAAEARVAVQNAQATIDEERITSPISGTIVTVDATNHESVQSGAPLAVLASRTSTIQASLAQQDLATVHAGQRAIVTVPGAPESLSATVVTVGIASSPSTTSFPVTLAVAHAPAWLRPGDVVAAAIVTRSYPAATLVPEAAVVSFNGSPQVFVVDRGRRAQRHKRAASGRVVGRTGRVRLLRVHVGLSNGTTAMVTGVAPGTAVVTLGQTYLARGAAVRIVGVATVPRTVTGSTTGGLIDAPSLPLSASGGAASRHSRGAGGRAGGG